MIYDSQKRIRAIEQNRQLKEIQISLRARSNVLRVPLPFRLPCLIFQMPQSDQQQCDQYRRQVEYRTMQPSCMATLRLVLLNLVYPLRISSRDNNSRQDQRKDRRTSLLRRRYPFVAAADTCPVAAVLADSTFAAEEGHIGPEVGRSPGLAGMGRASRSC